MRSIGSGTFHQGQLHQRKTHQELFIKGKLKRDFSSRTFQKGLFIMDFSKGKIQKGLFINFSSISIFLHICDIYALNMQEKIRKNFLLKNFFFDFSSMGVSMWKNRKFSKSPNFSKNIISRGKKCPKTRIRR